MKINNALKAAISQGWHVERRSEGAGAEVDTWYEIKQGDKVIAYTGDEALARFIELMPQMVVLIANMKMEDVHGSGLPAGLSEKLGRLVDQIEDVQDDL